MGSVKALFRVVTVVGFASMLALFSGCTFKKAELGTKENPVKLFFTPSVDAKVVNASAEEIKTALERLTPYKFDVLVPQNYVAVVEAFGSKKADVAALNTFGYVMAHERYGVEARLTVIRHNMDTYQGQIIARADSKINELKDLEGKKFAFVDPASTSGYLWPLKLLKDAAVKTGETMFAAKHDNVVSMVYQGQVDAGATYYSPPDEEGAQDARRLVKAQYPDVESKIKIIKLTDPIPNDPIVFRKDMPEEMKVKITDAFVKMVETATGKEAFKKVYSVTELKRATDADYAKVIVMLKDLGKDASQLLDEASKAKKK